MSGSRVDGSSSSRVLNDQTISTVTGWSSFKINEAIGNDPGDGNMVGPPSSSNNAICRFDGATGVLVKNSAATVTDGGRVDAVALSITNQYQLPGARGNGGDSLLYADGECIWGRLSEARRMLSELKFYNGHTADLSDSGDLASSWNPGIVGALLLFSEDQPFAGFGYSLSGYDINTAVFTNIRANIDLTPFPSWTHCFWIKTPSPLSADAGLLTVLSNTTNLMNAYYEDSTGKIRLQGTGVTPYTSTAVINQANWTHIAIVHDRDNRFLRLYVDGVLDGSTPWLYDRIALPVTRVEYHSSTMGEIFFDGISDNWRIYDGAMTLAEINLDKSNSYVPAVPRSVVRQSTTGQTAASLVSIADDGTLDAPIIQVSGVDVLTAVPASLPPINDLPFDGTLDDGGSNGAVWTASSTPVYTLDSKYGSNALSMGTYNVVTPTAGVAFAQNFTVAFWTKNGGNGLRGVFQIDSMNGSQFELYSDASGFLNVNGATVTSLITGTVAMSGTYQHYCVVYNGSGNIYIYVDGVLDVSGTSTGNLTGSAGMRLGNTTDHTSFYSGFIDNLRVYDRALSPQEVISDRDNLTVAALAANAIPRLAADGLTLAGSGATVSADGLITVPNVALIDSASFPPTDPAQLHIRLEGGTAGMSILPSTAFAPDFKNFIVIYADPSKNGGLPPLAIASIDDGASIQEERTFMTANRVQMIADPNVDTKAVFNILSDGNQTLVAAPRETGLWAKQNTGTRVDWGLLQSGVKALSIVGTIDAGGDNIVIDQDGTHLGNDGTSILTVNTNVKTDAIVEKTLDAGVRIETVLHKDGEIDLESSNKVVNVPTPTNAGDAVPKNYVDARVHQDKLIGFYSSGTTEKIGFWGGTHGGSVTSNTVPHTWMPYHDVQITDFRLIADQEADPRTVIFRIYVNGSVVHTYTSAATIDNWTAITAVADSGISYYDALQTLTLNISAGDRVACTTELSGAGTPEINVFLGYHVAPGGALALESAPEKPPRRIEKIINQRNITPDSFVIISDNEDEDEE